MSVGYFPGDPRPNRGRMLAGDLSIADGLDSAERARRAVRLADRYHRAFVADGSDARSRLSELIGALGEDAEIRPPLCVDYGDHITIGGNSAVGAGPAVTRGIPADAVAVGDPARVTRGI